MWGIGNNFMCLWVKSQNADDDAGGGETGAGWRKPTDYNIYVLFTSTSTFQSSRAKKNLRIFFAISCLPLS